MIPATDSVDKIIMQGVHMELTGELQQAIRDKFSVLFRHSDRIVRVHVRLHHDQTRGKQHFYAATGQVEIGGPDLVATVRGEDAYAVLDGLAETLSEQLRDRHERYTDRRRDVPQVDQAAQ